MTIERELEKFLADHLVSLARATKLAVLDALAGGDVARASDLMLKSVAAMNVADLRDELRAMVWAAAAKAAIEVQRTLKQFVPTALQVRFDALNPRSVAFVQQYEFDLIRQISEAVRAGVRTMIGDGITAGRNPNAIARSVRQIVGLTDQQVQWVLNFRKELETFHLRTTGGAYNLGAKIARTPGGLQAFPIDPATGLPTDMILARRLRDFRYDPILQGTIKTGVPLSPEKIDEMVSAYSRKLLSWRSRMIARTEARRAQEMGSYLMWRQAQDSGLFPEGAIRRYWITARDERVRLSHRPIPAMNPAGVGLDQPFATPAGEKMGPPIAPNCRCGVIYRVLEAGSNPVEWAPE